jgi:hypothetical protein
MKRSTQVLLTLMLPAVAAFGCDSAKKPPLAKPANCSGPAKPGEPPKTEVCVPAEGQANPSQTASSNAHQNNTNHTTRTGSYMPWFWLWGGGGRFFGGNSGVQAPSMPGGGPVTSTSPNQSSFSSGSRPAGAPSGVSSGGFGRTGSSFSSGS